MNPADAIDNIPKIIVSQKNFYLTHATRDISFRIDNLFRLKQTILKHELEIFDSLKKDLGKSRFEAYVTEVGLTIEEISYHIRHLKKWARSTRVRTNLINLYSRSSVIHQPFGLVLIMAPWNAPFHLLIHPLVGAISAGNCITLKLSEYSGNTAETIKRIITETFDQRYISIFNGGPDVVQKLLDCRYDYIFFTGGIHLGRIVMEKASKYLTPVTLELGGKSPCIVEDDANLNIAARRIVFGKLLNAGQICVAPDYLLVNIKVKEQLIEKIKNCIVRSYGSDPHLSPDYGRIINKDHFLRLTELMKTGDVIFGGEIDEVDRYIAPTLIDNVKYDDPIMQEEIFGPILPVIEYHDLNEVIPFLNSREKPLAFYFFSSDKYKVEKILSFTTSGGGCINDTMMHLTNPNLPFGGVGYSGMGSYHGEHSFNTFSHHRSILSKATFLDIPLRYAPFKNGLKVAKYFFK
jgi:acyl-CoA reductase-like NAD-dependent aldehyde dehydrogenase